MSLRAVARKEFQDAVRTRTLRGLTILFVCFAGFLALLQFVPPIHQDSTVPTPTLALLNSLRQPTIFLVPLVGMGIGYAAIAGERETGSLKLLLGPPNTRGEVVFGKFIGRTAVVAVSILTGFAAAALIALLTYESFALWTFAVYTLLTLAYGAVYIAIAVGISARLSSKGRALGVVVCLYAVFLLFWDVGLLGLQLLTVGSELPPGGLPDWIQLVGVGNPSTAFAYASRAVIPEYHELTIFPESDAFYLQDWIGFVVLAVWLLGSLAYGYVHFRRVDL